MHIVQNHCLQTTQHFVHTLQLIYKKIYAQAVSPGDRSCCTYPDELLDL